MSDLLFTDKGFQDYLIWQEEGPKARKRFNRLLLEVKRDHFHGTGKPEPLKGNLAGHWSRRIDSKHRLVYQVEGEIVRITSCRDHYGDK